MSYHIDAKTIKDPRDALDIVKGIDSFPSQGKIQKPINLRLCAYTGCKVKIRVKGGKKYCSIHSVDRKYDLQRKV